MCTNIVKAICILVTARPLHRGASDAGTYKVKYVEEMSVYDCRLNMLETVKANVSWVSKLWSS